MRWAYCDMHGGMTEAHKIVIIKPLRIRDCFRKLGIKRAIILKPGSEQIWCMSAT